MTPRDRRPDNEQGPVNWGIMPKRTPRPKSASARPGGNGLLEVVRSGNNPAPTGSSASATSSASGVSAASAAGSAGAHDASGAAVMTEEDLRSAAAQAIASGTADAVDAAIAIDLADVSDEPTGWAGSALSAGSPASPVALRAVGGPADTPGGHGASVPTGDPDSLPASAAGTAGTPSSPAPQQQRTAAANGAESRSPRPVVRPTAVDGPGSAPQTGTTTTRVFTISQGKPEAVPSSASTASAASAASVAAAPPPVATSAAPAPAPAAPAVSAPSAAAPSARGRGYQTRPSAATASPAAPTSPAAQPEVEEDAGILAESSAWEAATNALDAEEIKAQGGTDWGVGRGPAKGRGTRRPSSGTDWGVGRGSAKGSAARTRSPWPAAVRRQRLAGVAFALLGLILATASAMNLARNAEAGHPWIPPWLVAVLGGAGLVAAAGYLAWAGGTPVRREAERWKPGVLDAAAGLTTGSVKVHDPARLVARARGPLLPGTSGRGDETAPTVDSGPTPVMGTSTVDQSLHAPAGVAGAVGGFMLASAVVCAVVALILGPSWLIATAALTLGGVVAIRLAGEWLGQV
ncbi:hypothetical protein BKH17_01945 [Actinomyces oris]|uniref:hypothetical protein n=1 Tax=Actinomyces TaxID=1654 RepID=UPI000949E721|nr:MULTISPECIES: hypothetical protein [Actinomyces]OLL13289.1 hypothetical protein BKH17_01945 [Actinomyces oris]QLF52613.1 hypothetical protein HW274_01790 [Actinomyces sp. oral taxon 169]